VPVVALLLATAGFGTAAVFAVPDLGTGIGIWPAGAATAALLLTPRRSILPVVAVVTLLATATIGLTRPAVVSVGFAAGIGFECWVVWRIFTRGAGGRPPLRDATDLTRFVAASGAGALVVGVVVAATCWLTGFGDPAVTALTVASAQASSQLTVLPLFARLRSHASTGSVVERAVQWLMVGAVTLVAFLPHHFPSLAFLVVPVLAWAALRANPYEALAQMLAVYGIAIQLTTAGYGPFSDVPAHYGLPVDSRPVLLATFGIACALVVVPMMLTVGEQLANAREAAAERDKVQQIVNGATGVAIIGTDELGRMTLFNPGAQRLLGYEQEEVLGRSTAMLHTPSAIREKALELGVPDDFAEVARTLAAPERAGTEIRFRRKDGTERSHSMTLSRLVDDRGRVAGYVSTSEDVTERLEAQAALETALAVERSAVERLREVDRVKDAFVGSVSHELRTPITSIVGYLEMLEDGEFGALRDAQADAVRRVRSNSGRLLQLIDDLLTLSRVEDGGLQAVDRVLDLRALVRAGHDVVAPAWVGRDLEVRLDLPTEPVPFLGDRDMVERAVVNLVGNAVKFTPEGGRIDVALAVLGCEALLEVADSGIGIAPGERDQVFSRFFRSAALEKRAIPGSGLGLSITRGVVERHGGRIELESEEGSGTTFRVWLPVVV
jgi:hypothetical protein